MAHTTIGFGVLFRTSGKGEKGRAYLGACRQRSVGDDFAGVPTLAQSSPPARLHRQEREYRDTTGRRPDLVPLTPNRTLVRRMEQAPPRVPLALTPFSPPVLISWKNSGGSTTQANCWIRRGVECFGLFYWLIDYHAVY
jgi:hypothetical protein